MGHQTEQKKSSTALGFGKPAPFFGKAAVQAKLTVNAPGDVYEQEADAVADKVMRMPDAPGLPLQRKPIANDINPVIQRSGEGGNNVSPQIASSLQSNKGQGRSLPDNARRWMESRFGTDFRNVNIHTGTKAVQLSRELNAQAFTHGSDIYFNEGKFAPETADGKRLLAHELTHVVQQNHLHDALQRAVELRPPGRGEASAFNRVGQLIDRINEQSDRVRYFLRGNRIEYQDVAADEIILNPFGVRSPNFDHQMKGYIDRREVVPMRLITSSGRVGGGPLLVDSLQEAYVDLDDLLGRDDLSFQMNLIHILTERFGVNDYERRIGTNMPEFNRVHRQGLEDEAAHLQSVIGDPTIRFVYEETRPNGTLVFSFRSDEGYRVFHVFRGAGRAERTGEIFVQMPDGQRLTIQGLRAARRAIAQP